MKRSRGNCYVTCEALYHLLGGRASGYVPHTVRHEGSVHWYLVLRTAVTTSSTYHDGYAETSMVDRVVDPTASQFKTTPDYSRGRGRGFLTKRPSKRARALMRRLVWQDAD
jgi:hypothetical protein